VLGTNNWDIATKNLLLGKGARHIIICGDGDDAGRRFTETVYHDLTEDFIPSVFPCEEGSDPGSMKVKHIKVLRNIVDSYRPTMRHPI